jgi:hypothetical protein
MSAQLHLGDPRWDEEQTALSDHSDQEEATDE